MTVTNLFLAGITALLCLQPLLCQCSNLEASSTKVFKSKALKWDPLGHLTKMNQTEQLYMTISKMLVPKAEELTQQGINLVKINLKFSSKLTEDNPLYLVDARAFIKSAQVAMDPVYKTLKDVMKLEEVFIRLENNYFKQIEQLKSELKRNPKVLEKIPTDLLPDPKFEEIVKFGSKFHISDLIEIEGFAKFIEYLKYIEVKYLN